MKISEYLLSSMHKYAYRRCVQSMTYHDMIRSIDQHKKTLLALKIRPNDRICVSLPKSPEFIALMIAGWDLGCVMAPLPPHSSQHLIQKIKPCLHVHDSGWKPYASRPHQESGDQSALILFTSGSTSDPKGVVLSHKNVIHNLEMINNLFDQAIDCHDTSFSILPWHHCYGLVCEWLYLFSKGATIVLPNTTENIFSQIRKASPTLLYTVPKMLSMIHNAPYLSLFPKIMWKRMLFGSRLRMISAGGSFCAPYLIDMVQENLRIPLYQGYGMTECSPMISLNGPHQNKPYSVGKPLYGVDVKLDDNDALLIRSPSLMKGYLSSLDNNVLKTDLSLRDAFYFETGDRAKMDPDGYLFITGRTKEEFKLTNGKYVSPIYIESCVASILPSDQLVVFPSKDHRHVICVFYAKKRVRETLFRSIRHHPGLQPYEIPRQLFQLQEPLPDDLTTLKMEPKRDLLATLFFQNKLNLYPGYDLKMDREETRH